MEKSNSSSGSKPTPPPLETIPSRKMSAGGRHPAAMSSSGNKPETLAEETENDVDDASAKHAVTITVSSSSPVPNSITISELNRINFKSFNQL